MLMLFILHQPVFQPVIHEPLSNPDHVVHQDGVNGDVVENRGTSQEAPVHTKESQGKNTTMKIIVSKNSSQYC